MTGRRWIRDLTLNLITFFMILAHVGGKVTCLQVNMFE